AAAKAGPPGRSQRSAQRHRDEDLRHRQRQGPAAFHRAARQPPRRDRDPQAGRRRAQDHAGRGAEPGRGLPTRPAPRPYLRGDHATSQGIAAAGGKPGTIMTPAQGILEFHNKGYGFLRNPAKNYVAQPGDPFVDQRLIQKFKLRKGMQVAGPTEPGQRGSGPRLKIVAAIEGLPPEKLPQRNFDELTPTDPHERIRLESGKEPLTMRVMDLLTPIGKGQRGLIVAPPRTGKTILLQHLAQAVAKNHPEMHTIMLLIDERPEEVTEMRRTV